MNRNIELHWEITNDCNLRCKHCIVNSGDNKTNNMQKGDIIKFLEKIKNYNVTINFTGGEPFFRKDFKDILEFCINNNFKINIISNGLLLNDTYINIIKKHSISLGISVESFIKEHYEKIRGNNTFKILIDNLKRLHDNKVNFDIYTTLNNYNINDIENIIKTANAYGAKIHFNDITVDGRAIYNKEILLMTDINVIEKITDACNKVFGLKELYYDEYCWASNEVLFISSEGDIFMCTELCRCNKKTKIGNIRTFPIAEYYEKCPKIDFYDFKLHCTYKVYFNDYMTYNSNTNAKCALLPKNEVINNLEDLYNEFDLLLINVFDSCKRCTYKDCMGFIWLLKEEKKLYDQKGITTININENVDFLYFLKEYESIPLDELDFKKIKYPKCEHRCEKTGNCLIHNLRPLVCHMYPLGIETSENGIDMWVLHDECEFTQRLLRENKLGMFLNNFYNIINRISSDLYNEIINEYKKVDNLSLFLNGINSYIILKEVDKNVKM